MIILELSIFLISIILLSFSFAGFGSLISFELNRNFFEEIFLGFVIVALVITLTHFFFKINFLISLLVFLVGLFLFYKNKNSFDFLKKKINLRYLFLIIFLIPMFISQKYHEDFGYYHLPYSLALIEEKIVFGFANIDKPFVYNSIWLNLNPIFFLKNNNFNFQTLPVFLLFIIFIIFSLNKILEKQSIKISDFYLVLVIFYFLLKFTRISEFGVDIPAVIFSVLGIYYFIKFYEVNETKKNFCFYLNFTFSIFSVLIKFSTIPILIFTIYLYLSNFKTQKFNIFRKKFFLIYFLCLCYFTQQFIYTGCFIFPSNLTCLNVSWFNSDYLNLSKQLELTNKGFYNVKDNFSPDEYLSNLKWFLFWIKRNSIEIIEHLITIFLPTIFFLFTLRKKKEKYLIFKKKTIFLFFLIISLVYWLSFSPVVRFAIHIFIILAFLSLINIFSLKEFSKKKFLIFVLVFLIFNVSKNVLRIIKTENIFLGIQKVENRYILNRDISNEYIDVYYPDIKNNKKNGWQGRLCWNTPFICSYNELGVSKKNGYLIIKKIKN